MIECVREYPASLEVAEGRTIRGRAMPWGEVAEVRDGMGPWYLEEFQRGAFAQSIRGPVHKVKAFDRHREAIGRASSLSELDDGLWCDLYVSQTSRGDEVLSLVRDGVLDGLSVRFEPVSGKSVGSEAQGHVIRTEVRLLEVSVVPWGAYAGALVESVRERPPATPRLDAMHELLRGAGLRS